jgi:lipopolysaccharide transport system ATP-binding protein
MPDYAIEVDKLGKLYRVNPSMYGYNLLSEQIQKVFLPSFLRRRSAEKGDDYFWALQDASFKVERGKVVGVIGGNGSGKSTLLKIMSRITKPSAGKIVLNGRVSSLLEINVGFHPELTGRENIYLLGTILGLTRAEIALSFDEIVDFAELHKFLDTPVKHYSSGMFLRLGFAVAAHLKPDILFIDEILAVGDVAFQRKCMRRIETMARAGRTVLYVSHQLESVRRLCDHCIVLTKGKLQWFDSVEEGIEEYIRSVGLGDDNSVFSCTEDPNATVQVIEAKILDGSGAARSRFDISEPIVIQVQYVVRDKPQHTYLEMSLSKNGEAYFSSWDTDKNPERFSEREPGTYTATITLPAPFIKPGHHTVGFYIGNRLEPTVVQRLDNVLGFEVQPCSSDESFVSLTHGPGNISVPLEWQTIVSGAQSE